MHTDAGSQERVGLDHHDDSHEQGDVGCQVSAGGGRSLTSAEHLGDKQQRLLHQRVQRMPARPATRHTVLAIPATLYPRSPASPATRHTALAMLYTCHHQILCMPLVCTPANAEHRWASPKLQLFAAALEGPVVKEQMRVHDVHPFLLCDGHLSHRERHDHKTLRMTGEPACRGRGG